MIIERVVVGPLQTNSYIIGEETTGEAIIIDPGDEPDRIMDLIKEHNLKVITIVCTHGHFDHIGATGDIKRMTGAKVLIHSEEVEIYNTARDQAAFWGYEIDDIPEPEGFIGESDEVRAGNICFKVLHTPGHSPGGICLYGEGIVITGDTIFQGSVGRTDFPGGDIIQLKQSVKRLLDLPEETKILSGHGPETTVGREQRENIFIHELRL